MIEMAHRYDKLVPGAFTPTEIKDRVGLGADLVNCLPRTGLSGLLHGDPGPLPQTRLVPTGGVDVIPPSTSCARRRGSVRGQPLISAALAEGRFDITTRAPLPRGH